MNLVEVWIEDIIDVEDVIFKGDKKLKITFNTICWGAKGVESRLFNDMSDWEEFKANKFYLG